MRGLGLVRVGAVLQMQINLPTDVSVRRTNSSRRCHMLILYGARLLADFGRRFTPQQWAAIFCAGSGSGSGSGS